MFYKHTEARGFQDHRPGAITGCDLCVFSDIAAIVLNSAMLEVQCRKYLGIESTSVGSYDNISIYLYVCLSVSLSVCLYSISVS